MKHFTHAIAAGVFGLALVGGWIDSNRPIGQ